MPDYSRLKSILVQSKIQKDNNPLYQVILALIDGVIDLNNRPTATTVTTKGGTSRLFWLYNANAHATAGYPGDKYLLWDNASQVAAANIFISHISSDGVDLDIVLSFIAIGQTIIIQDSNDSANSQTWTISGAPVNVNPGTATSYWTFPVTLVTSAGLGTTGFPHNHQLAVIVF